MDPTASRRSAELTARSAIPCAERVLGINAFATDALPADDEPPVDGTRVDAARRLAGRLHRAEPMLAVISAFGAVVVAGSVALSIADGFKENSWGGALLPLVGAGALVLAAGGAVALGAIVTRGEKNRKRPFGLIWDLVGFLPRTAHPFSPPCYAERAVSLSSLLCKRLI